MKLHIFSLFGLLGPQGNGPDTIVKGTDQQDYEGKHHEYPG